MPLRQVGLSVPLVALSVWLALSCDRSTVSSPFPTVDAGGQRDAGDKPNDGDPDEQSDASVGYALGGPCLDDGQCDDEIDCTFDECDSELGRCKFSPNHAKCEDDTYCNGVEICDLQLGCGAGDPITCSDISTCTIDSCVEAERSCVTELRDADGDGDADHRCKGGGDCNERDPNVSSLLPEVCDNGQDDDCDEKVDEKDCEVAEYDTCDKPLIVDSATSVLLNPATVAGDYSASCAEFAFQHDFAVVVEVPEGPSQDVDISALSARTGVALALTQECGVAATEIACAVGGEATDGDTAARLKLRALPPGSYPILVFSRDTAPLSLSVDFAKATQPPTNETCGTAIELIENQHARVDVASLGQDLRSDCFQDEGELVYFFDLDEVRDVHVFAAALDNFGKPILSLRSAVCSDAEDELACTEGQNVELFARALPPGRYYVAVSATGPAQIDVVLDLRPPTDSPEDEDCVDAPLLPQNQVVEIDLSDHVDDIETCLPRAPDAAYTLEFEEPTDLLLVERISSGDTAAISLHNVGCSDAVSIACNEDSRSPVRIAGHDLSAGSYRVVAESSQGKPVTVSALTRPATAPIFVAYADRCDQAVPVPARGALFQGNTANAKPDYDASCDLGGLPEGGAPDQMLKMTLTKEQRVVLDARGSAFPTLINVRKADGCPGSSVMQACSVGLRDQRSYLDLQLPKGEYYIQVDGYAGRFGEWFLNVFIVDP